MKKIILLFFASIVMTLAISGIVVIAFPVLARLNENQKMQQEQQEELLQREQFYDSVEQICLEYVLGENELLFQEFNTFLEKNEISQDHILNYVKRLKIYNEIKYTEYIEAQKQLETDFNNKQISGETFKKEKQALFKKYENSKNSLEDYLTSSEKNTFEQSKETLEQLFDLI